MMARTVEEVLASGYVTPAERTAMVFAEAWSKNEERMGEQAALMVTIEQLGLTYDDFPDVYIPLPEGAPWGCLKHLPTRTDPLPNTNTETNDDTPRA